MGFGRSRWCSWIVEIAGSGARRPSPASESYRKGHDVEARRSNPAISSSFDEATVEKDWVLPQKEHDRERQRLASDRPLGRIRQREGVLLGGLSIESLQVRAVRVRRRPRKPKGNRGEPRKPDDIEGQTEAGGSPSSEASPEVTSFAYASAWRAAVEAIFERESGRGR